MQVLAISKPKNIEEAELIHRHHGLRARVFADRLGWDVKVVDGLELDAFDILMPTYIWQFQIAVRWQDARAYFRRLGPQWWPRSFIHCSRTAGWTPIPR